MRGHYDVVMVAMNGIATDSRVIRTARSAARLNLSTLLVGVEWSDARATPQQLKLSLPGIDAILLPAVSPPTGPSDLPAAERHAQSVARFRDAALSHLSGLDPRVLHTHDMWALGVGDALRDAGARRRQAPYWIHDVHEWVAGLDTIDPDLRAMALELEANHLAGADRVTTVSPALAHRLESQYDVGASVLLNAPVEADYRPDYRPTIRDVVGVEPGTALLVYSGATKKARGVHDVVAALPKLGSTHFVVVTDRIGGYVDRLAGLALEFGVADRFHLVPYVPVDEVSSFLQSADVGIHPMPRGANADVALPNKLFEYIHAGLPVLTSDCRAIADFVSQHGVGAAYAYGDHEALAMGLRSILEAGPDLRSQAEALRHRYSWEAQEERLHAAYAPALGVKTISFGPRLNWDSTPDPGSEPRGEQKLRVLHGVGGQANQPATLARALRQRGHFARNILLNVPKFGYEAFAYVPISGTDTGRAFDLIEGIASDFDVVHLHARSILWRPRSFGFPTMMDLLLLRLLGSAVVFHFRGTEARLASAFARDNPFHYVEDDPYSFASKFPEPVQRLIIDFARGMADAVLVTDPELETYVPGARIVQRAIDLEDWTPVGVSTASRPRVIHAPSRDQIKGTEFVIAAVERLRGEGLDFEFELIQGLSHAEARRRYQEADIIVDQLRIGWYGVLGVEGMALAKPVIAYVRRDLEHHLGSNPPLAVADPETVVEVLRRLILDEALRRRLGTAGRRWVEAHHDARVVARDLESVYREAIDRRQERGTDYELIAGYLRFQAELAEAQETAAVRARAQVTKGLREVSTLIARRGRGQRESADEGVATVARAAKARLTSALESLEEGVRGPIAHHTIPERKDVGGAVQLRDVLEPDAFGLAAPTTALTRGAPLAWDSLERDWTADDHAAAREILAGVAIAWKRASPADRVILGAWTTRLVAVLVRHMRVEAAGWVPVARRDDSSRPPVLVTDQVEIARSVHNARAAIPAARATQIVAGVMRPLVTPVSDGGLFEDFDGVVAIRQASDRPNSWNLGELFRVAINGYAASRLLPDGVGAQRWERMVADLATLALAADVEEFHTSRTTLVTRVPLRIGVQTVGPARGPFPVHAVDGLTLEHPRVVGDRERIAWWDATAAFHVWRCRTGPFRLLLSSEVEGPVLVSMPRLAFDPMSAEPRLVGWRSPVEALTDHRMANTVLVRVPPELAAQGSGLAHFRFVDGAPVNVVLAAHVRSLERLARLYPGHAFGQLASKWSAYLARGRRLGEREVVIG